jgi:hypothetical protein
MSETTPPELDLLYPFYLDEEMLMAFAAAITGGVALTSTQTERSTTEAESSKGLEAQARLMSFFSGGGHLSSATNTGSSFEDTAIRQHTTASIFIELNAALKQANRIQVDPAFDEVEVGSLVSARVGPAIAPLRRVIDQVIRLLTVMIPMVNLDASGDPQVSTQKRKSNQGKQPITQEGEDSAELQMLLGLFTAMRDDLDQSGMIDVVVRSVDGSPGVLMTLDKRFVKSNTLELIHTSEFTVVGKVTRRWDESEEFVNLFRGSSLSLVPRLAGVVSMMVWKLLIDLGKNIDFEAEHASVFGPPDEDEDADSHASHQPESDEKLEQAPDENLSIGDDALALMPGLDLPAYQLLPLAISA